MGNGDGQLGLEGISPDIHTWAVSIQVHADAKPTFGSLGSPNILPVKTETNSWGLKIKNKETRVPGMVEIRASVYSMGHQMVEWVCSISVRPCIHLFIP